MLDDSFLNEYELSIWEDITANIQADHFDERKLAVIASKDLDTPNRAYHVTLKENVNGEKTLTFSLMRQIMNEDGDYVDNPFLFLLSNERKLKLRDGAAYEDNLEAEDDEDRWHTFIIKDINEDKVSGVNNYVCKEIFINELGKNGWSILLDSELMNNYGTINELSEKVLDGSDWVVSSRSSRPIEKIEEQLFYFTIEEETGINIINVINSEISHDNAKGTFYPFYSQCEYKTINNVAGWYLKHGQIQLIWTEDDLLQNHISDELKVVDDDNAFNYYYTVASDILVHALGSEKSFSDKAIQGNRVVESYSSHYDSTTEKYVYDYKVTQAGEDARIEAGDYTLVKDEIVYGYDETQYITPNILLNYVANAKNIVSTSAWEKVNMSDEAVESTIQLPVGENAQTYPMCNITKAPIPDDAYIKNYLIIKDNDERIINTGLRVNNLHLIKGNKYVIRMKARKIIKNSSLKDITRSSDDDPYEVAFDASDFDVTNTYSLKAGLVTFTLGSGIEYLTGSGANGSLITISQSSYNTTQQTYERYGYAQLSGTRSKTLNTIHTDEQGYTYIIVEARRTTKSLGEPIYLYLTPDGQTTNNKYWNIEDIQVFDYYESNNTPMFPEDVPTETIVTNRKFFKNIQTATGTVAYELPTSNTYYEQVKRENFEPVRHIDIKESNYFNNINSIAELFEMWVQFRVVHLRNGKIKYDSTNNRFEKEIIYHKYAPGRENWAGFRPGINLTNIKRTVDSNDIATKIIVKDNNNEYATDGICSIRRAKDNISGDNTIYSFDHYLMTGMLDSTQLLSDLYGLSSGDLAYLIKSKEINTELMALNEKLVKFEGELRSMEEYSISADISVQTVVNDMAKEQDRYNNLYESRVDKTESYDPSTDKDLLASLAKINNYRAQYDSFKEEYLYYSNQKDEYEAKLNGGFIGSLQIKEYCGKRKTGVTYIPGQVTYTDNIEELYYYTINSQDNGQWVAIGQNVDKLSLVSKIQWISDKKKELDRLFYKKYSRFILEATWTDDQYMDNDLYYYDAKKILNQNSSPKLTYQIQLIDVSPLEDFFGYSIRIGDSTYIEDPEFFGYKQDKVTPIHKQVIVTELTRNFDDPSKTAITVKTYKDQYEELFSKMASTTTSLQYASGGYQRAANVVQPNGQIEITSLENSIANNAFVLSVAQRDSVLIGNSNGIEVKDLDDPNMKTRITSHGVVLTQDGGRSWTTGITAAGINASMITTGVLNTENVVIMHNNSSAFKWDYKGITAYVNDARNEIARFSKLGIYGTTNGQLVDNVIASNPSATPEELYSLIKDNLSYYFGHNGFMLKTEGGKIVINSDDPVYNNDILIYQDKYDEDAQVIRVALGFLQAGDTTQGIPDTYGIRVNDYNGNAILQNTYDGLELSGKLDIYDNKANPTYNISIGKHTSSGDSLQTTVISLTPIVASGEELDPTLPTFRVTQNGKLYATNGSFSGYIEATDGIFHGKVEAGSGYIGGFVIKDNGLYSELGDTNPFKVNVAPTEIRLSKEEKDIFLVNEDGLKVQSFLKVMDNNDGFIGIDGINGTIAPYDNEGNQILHTYLIKSDGSVILGNKVTIEDELKFTKTYVDSEGHIQVQSESFIYNPDEHDGLFIKSQYDENGVTKTGLSIYSDGTTHIKNGFITGYLTNSDPDGFSSWKIGHDGTAEFTNANISGKLTTVTFEKNSVQAVNGSMILLESKPIKNVTVDANAHYRFELDDTVDGYWSLLADLKDFLIIDSSISEDSIKMVCHQEISPNDTDSTISYYFTTATSIEDPTKLIGNLLYCIDSSFIVINGNSTKTLSMPQKSLGVVDYKDGAYKPKIILGTLPGDIIQGTKDDSGNFMDEYGLYADNAFLKGVLAVQNDKFSAGISTKIEPDEEDENQIVIWAGAPKDNADLNSGYNIKAAPFLVDSGGNVKINNGIFTGVVQASTIYTPVIRGVVTNEVDEHGQIIKENGAIIQVIIDNSTGDQEYMDFCRENSTDGLNSLFKITSDGFVLNDINEFTLTNGLYSAIKVDVQTEIEGQVINEKKAVNSIKINNGILSINDLNIIGNNIENDHTVISLSNGSTIISEISDASFKLNFDEDSYNFTKNDFYELKYGHYRKINQPNNKGIDLYIEGELE